MKKGNCAAHCSCDHASDINRRQFIRNSSITAAGMFLMNGYVFSQPSQPSDVNPIRACGPASRYITSLRAAFVRRKEDYGILWPGAVYDGEAALKMYTDKLNDSAKKLGVKLDLRTVPVYTSEEADAWLKESKTKNPDGLILVLLDRQKIAWPTAKIVADSGIPSIIFSPLGTSFTSNTMTIADQPGCVIFSTNDFSQVESGMKMLQAGSRMKRARCAVIRGNERAERILADTGITLQYIPAVTFMNEYNAMPVSREIEEMADGYIRLSRQVVNATRQDVINGIKSYKVAGNILEKEQADAISMDCLGALGPTPISLPCIAWSRMNDDGIPAACEADTGAIAAHIMVQYLFDRPAFQQDPVADTSDDTIIGAHCSSPTRLNGFKSEPEPFDLTHHHGNRDAVPKTIWKISQRITCFDVLPGDTEKNTPSELLISTGTVKENMQVPPSGGCVVSIKVKMDDEHKVLTYPGFHQLFFYGDYKKELVNFAQLYNFKATVI